MSMAKAAKVREQPNLAKSTVADLNVIMGDGKVSSLTELLLDIFLRTLSKLVSMDSVDLALSFKL